MTKFHAPAGSIVVGVDGSADSERAVTWAAHQALLERRPLAVVHSTDQLVLRETAWLDVQGIDHRRLTTALESAARAVLDRSRERAELAAPGVEVHAGLVRDDPRVALYDASSTARLVVVGSRGRGPLRTPLLGSVSASVAKHGHCPVVVCRPPDASPSPLHRRVLVGTDGSQASRPALEFAFEHASLRRLPLLVMHCFWDVLAATASQGIVTPRPDDHLDDLRLLLGEAVAGLSEKYPDVDVTTELSRGLVDECLAVRSPAASLIVVGRSSPTGWDRFFHASCAMAVLERAHTTVAVVPDNVPEQHHRKEVR